MPNRCGEMIVQRLFHPLGRGVYCCVADSLLRQCVAKEISPVAKKESQPVKKQNRIVRYLREVKAEVQKIVWPSRRATLNLTGIVLAVTVVMSLALGLIDWLFSRLFALILG